MTHLCILGLTRPKGSEWTLAYELPQRFYSFYKVNTLNRYVLTYLFQAPFAIINNFCQASMDCLTITVTVHLVSQMAVLSLRIRDISQYENYEENTVRYYIKRHQKLLK